MVLYAGPFLLLASVWGFALGLGPAAAPLSVVLLLALLIGAEFVSPRKGPPRPFSRRNYRRLFYLYVPAQLASIGAAAMVAAHSSWLGFAGLSLSIGVATGVFGMLAAHELVHSRNRGERRLGALMLLGMLYCHFRVSHLNVHHRYAATKRDSATARRGENFYTFLARTVPGQFLEGLRFEQNRLTGKSMLGNRVLADCAIELGLVALLFALLPAGAPLFFLVQSAVAVAVLELFNYIAHYGLERSMDRAGRFGPLSDRHSWNSSNVLVNFLIFNMGRHSFHHAKPSISYERLEYVAMAPELPAGYAGSILLALVPPLWRRVMDAELHRLSLALMAAE